LFKQSFEVQRSVIPSVLEAVRPYGRLNMSVFVGNFTIERPALACQYARIRPYWCLGDIIDSCCVWTQAERSISVLRWLWDRYVRQHQTSSLWRERSLPQRDHVQHEVHLSDAQTQSPVRVISPPSTFSLHSPIPSMWCIE